MRSIAALLPQASRRLEALSDTSLLDAQVLLAHYLEKPRTWLLAHPDLVLSPDQEALFEQGLRRLESREPLPYVIGHWEFFGLDFEVAPGVLIPRPETELLVEKAILWAQTHPGRHAWDVGTGSACLPIAVAVHIPRMNFLATEVSSQALQIASRNARRHLAPGRIAFLQADLRLGLPASPAMKFDLITANLPYIPTATLQKLDVYRWEPALALDGGPQGLYLITSLVEQLPGRMAPHGLALLEIEATQGAAAAELACRTLPQAHIQIHSDLAGYDRLLEIKG